MKDMSLERTFITLTPYRLSTLIMSARRRVIYAAPSLTLNVATALVNARDRLGAEAIAIILDVSEGVLRLGYGFADAIAILREKKATIRDERGLRISIVVVDEQGLVFVPCPMLVEDNETHNHSNAVWASRDQIERLVQAVLPAPPGNSTMRITSAKAPQASLPLSMPPVLQRAEIGLATAPPERISKIEEAIKSNPVENFDLKRIVNVFSPYFQFYELEIINTHVERRTAKLPREILASIRDKATLERITAAFKMLSGDSKLSGQKIHDKAQAIRKRYIHHHTVYGGIMLKADQAALDVEIGELEKLVEDHKKSVANRFDQDAKKSVNQIVQAFWRHVSRHPPIDLVVQGIDKPTTEQAKLYLRRKLIQAFPRGRDLANKMEVKKVVKEITWNALNEKGFVDWLQKQWPDRSDLRQPFAAYHAAASAASKNSN